jgi:hypothetical protein
MFLNILNIFLVHITDILMSAVVATRTYNCLSYTIARNTTELGSGLFNLQTFQRPMQSQMPDFEK